MEFFEKLSRRLSTSSSNNSSSPPRSRSSINLSPDIPKYTRSYCGYQLMGCANDPLRLAKEYQEADSSLKIGIVISTDKALMPDLTSKEMLEECLWANAQEELNQLQTIDQPNSVVTQDPTKSKHVQKILHIHAPNLTEGATLDDVQMTYQNILLMAASIPIEMLILPRLSMESLGTDWLSSTNALKQALNAVQNKSKTEPVIMLWLGDEIRADRNSLDSHIECDKETFRDTQ